MPTGWPASARTTAGRSTAARNSRPSACRAAAWRPVNFTSAARRGGRSTLRPRRRHAGPVVDCQQQPVHRVRRRLLQDVPAAEPGGPGLRHLAGGRGGRARPAGPQPRALRRHLFSGRVPDCRNPLPDQGETRPAGRGGPGGLLAVHSPQRQGLVPAGDGHAFHGPQHVGRRGRGAPGGPASERGPSARGGPVRRPGQEPEPGGLARRPLGRGHGLRRGTAPARRRTPRDRLRGTTRRAPPSPGRSPSPNRTLSSSSAAATTRAARA